MSDPDVSSPSAHPDHQPSTTTDTRHDGDGPAPIVVVASCPVPVLPVHG